MKRPWLLLAVCATVLVALSLPAIARAEGPSDDPEPVPSLDPDWSANFVPPAVPRFRAATLCSPLDAEFYAATDWLRLAQKLRANQSACANYYVSVPPLADDKTVLRNNQAGPIRALGPHFHAMAEINITGWASWVAADSNRTWFDAGVEARRRMTAAGFDVAAGDIWAVNEFSSAVRTGAGNARQNMRDLVRGLYSGDGTAPVQGLVWVTGIGQPTTSLDLYKNNVKLWLGDAPFWEDMSRYVRFFSQEVYGSVTNWAVAGITPQDRLGPLVDYVEHFGTLAGRGPAEVATASAFLAEADAPLATAAWPRPAFGWPPLANPAPPALAQSYISAEVYALRHQQVSRPSQIWGFAWSPTTLAGEPPIANFVSKTAAILDSLAAAIHASDGPADDAGSGACGQDFSLCTGDFDKSSFNSGWHMFNTWSQPVAASSSAIVQENTAVDIGLTASDADGDPLTYTVVGSPAHGALSAAGSAVTYTPAAGYAGPDAFTFKVSDGVVDSAFANVSITVNAPPTVMVDPAGPIDEGAAPLGLTAHAQDPEGAPVTLSWSTSVGTLVPSGDTATLAVDDGPASAHVTVTADDGSGGKAQSSIDVIVRNVPPTADAGPDVSGVWGTPLMLAGEQPTDVSAADTVAGLSAAWSFGDGSTGEGPVAAHVYAEPGVYAATLTVRDKDGGESSDTTRVTVGARSARLEETTPPTLDAASAIASVRITDSVDTPSARVGGHAVTLAVGSTDCVAITNAAGAARCTLDRHTLPLGPQTVSATFDGDTLYTAATTSARVILYGLPAGGTFAVGDRSAAGDVVFWSPSWWLLNTLGGGAAPASFKGFTHPMTNGWTAVPGFDGVPAAVPAWMGVIVTRSVSKDESVIHGNSVGLVVVHVDSYDPTVGGHGTVVAEAR
ncbi:MAG: Ig-like domain-containing protein [Gaiellaceae bacterium]